MQLCDPLRTDEQRRDFVAAGAASGVSAAFGSPIGRNNSNTYVAKLHESFLMRFLQLPTTKLAAHYTVHQS